MSDQPLRRSSSEASFLTTKFPPKPHRVSKPFSIFVANLTSDLSNEQLASDVTDLFSQFGEISPVKVSRDSRNRPYAFVNFRNGETSSDILDQNLYLHSRQLRMERTKSHSTLVIPFISQLSYTSLEEIESFLLNFGLIEKLSLHCQKLSCTYTCKQDAMNALLFLQGSGIFCSLSKPIPGHLWIGNLPLEYTENELLNLFSPFGTVLHISPGQDFVLVTFKNFTDAIRACCLHGFEWKSKILHVTLYDGSFTRGYMYPGYPYFYSPYDAMTPRTADSAWDREE